MKAAYITRTGPAEEIAYGNLPEPTAGAHGVLVDVAAVAVNPIDTYIRSGAHRTDLPQPFIVGRDMTGIVAGTGPMVRRFKPGDHVWCNNQGYGGRQGTFAERLCIDERLLYHLPSGADPVKTVAVLHSGLTAVIGLFARARLVAGESVFAIGGDGNVGTAVLQLARASGARVAVTASEAKAGWCRELGADAVIDYKHQDVARAVREFAPNGVDVLWDASGTIDLEPAISLMARRGRLVLMSGLHRRSVLPVGMFYTRNCTMHGFTVTDATDDELAAYAAEINSRIASGALRARIHGVMPLSRAAEAHRLVERGGLFGKVVLVPER